MNYVCLNKVSKSITEYALKNGVEVMIDIDQGELVYFKFRRRGMCMSRAIGYIKNEDVILDALCRTVDKLVAETTVRYDMCPHKLPAYSFTSVNRNPNLKKVIYNGPATIAIWDDGTKTTVKCGENDIYDKEKGLAMATLKKIYGKKDFYKFFKNAEKVEVDQNKNVREGIE